MGMKIRKYNENNKSLAVRVELLSEKFSKIFEDLDDFEKIIIDDYEDNRYFTFTICFNRIVIDIMSKVEKFYLFIGLSKDDWIFQADNFNDEPMIFICITYSEEGIDACLEKFEIEENINKYNL